MGEFNMPPGVNTRDIPGNRPEDLAAEALYDKLEEIVGDIGEERMRKLYEFVDAMYGEGYKTALDECRMAKEMEEEEQ